MNRVRIAHVITRLCKGGAQEDTFHTVRLANRDRFDVTLISGPTAGAEGDHDLCNDLWFRNGADAPIPRYGANSIRARSGRP